MIAATVAMVLGAVLFAVFGTVAPADGRPICSGDCGGCGAGTCALDPDLDPDPGRIP